MEDPTKAKVMFPLAGRPLIDYVLDQSASLQPERVVVITGYLRDTVESHCAQHASKPLFAVQAEQLGTGHAVQQAEAVLTDFDGDVLILSGDVPMLTSATLSAFATSHADSGSALSVLSTSLDDATGYGRIVRDSSGAFACIVEHKDATEDQRAIREINSGIYLVDAKLLFQALQQTNNQNAQGEFYLTDIVSILADNGHTVSAWDIASPEEVQGINTKAQLQEAEQQVTELNND